MRGQQSGVAVVEVDQLLHDERRRDAERHDVCEAVELDIDYASRQAREWLDLPMSECRATMLRTARWKYIYYETFPPQLFDLENDPNELNDLGTDPVYEAIRIDLERELFHWFRHRKTRTTLTDSRIQQMFGGWNQAKRGVYVGYWSPNDIPAEAR